jgi:hypothetical protein
MEGWGIERRGKTKIKVGTKNKEGIRKKTGDPKGWLDNQKKGGVTERKGRELKG